MRTCRSCGASTPDIAKFCGRCGSAIEAQEARTCRACGKEMRPGDTFCISCGFGKAAMGESARPVTPTQVAPPLPTYQAPSQQSYGAPPPNLYSSGVKCRNCGYQLVPGQGRCQYCGSKVLSYNRKDWSGVAGGLLIVTGLLNAILFVLGTIGSFIGEVDEVQSVVLLVMAMVSFFTIWAGAQAMKRKRFKLCMVAAFLSIISFLFILSIIALVLLALSREAFEDDGRPFNAQMKRF